MSICNRSAARPRMGILVLQGRVAVNASRWLDLRSDSICFAHLANAIKESWDAVRWNVYEACFGLLMVLFNEKIPVSKDDGDFCTVRKDELIHDNRPRLVVEFTVYKTFCKWFADQETLGYGAFGLTDTLAEARSDCSERFSQFRVVEAIYAAND